jgi:hypothetical protein
VTEEILESEIFAFNLAPDPFPVGSNNSKSGSEKYSIPPNSILTDSKNPATMLGTMLASLPFCKDIFGYFSKFNVFDPYPRPLL